MSNYNISEVIDKHFPFEKYNPGQKKAIVFAVANLLKGKKHILMELPTGLGKSAIATTIHRVMREISLPQKAWRTSILTATKGLQDQYVKDDLEIYSLKGKTNYRCPFPGVTTYGTPGCMKLTHSGGCVPHAKCPYVKTRVHFMEKAELRLTNTSFQIKAPLDLIGAEKSRVNLTIIDECHEIDDRLIDAASLIIKKEDLEKFHVPCNGIDGKILDFINIFQEFGKGQNFHLDAELRGECEDLLSTLRDEILRLEKMGKTDASALILAGDLRSVLDGIYDFATGNGEWILEDWAMGSLLHLVPVYAYQVVDRALYSKCDQHIHMSATICGFEGYMRTMGIDPKDAAILDAPNPIPVESRIVQPLNAVKVSGSYSASSMARYVDMIIEKHGMENGIIHTVSFKLAKEILENSKYNSRMLISNDRREILSYLEGKGRILLSPSVETGYDFKGDLARWQILAKVPYGYLGSNYVKLNTDRDGKWYARKAIVRLVQAAGRAVRGVDDYAITYVLDSNFARLYNDNMELFPTWFKDSVTK